MIGTSLLEYIFIRACIYSLQSIAPICILYSFLSVLAHATKLSLPINLPPPFRFWALAELVFYIFVSLIYQEKLQHEALHPPAPSKSERQALFERCIANVSDQEAYLKGWFLDAPRQEIKRANLKEFFLWAFFNRDGLPGEDDEELEEYVVATEALLGRKLEEGRGNAICLRLTIDRACMSHRSLLWYFCVAFVDFLTCVRLHYHGLTFHRTALRNFLAIFPMRPLTLFYANHSPAKRLTYWHRPHTSRTRRPVIFIHGIGIGLYPYVNFLVQMANHLNDGHASDDQVGIIAVEIMPVSFRITHSAQRNDEMCEEVQAIINQHGYHQPVLVAHSYGTVIATQLLKSAKLTAQIGSVVLIDPISILLHLPDVAYNFTRRKPKRANEHQLHYFASMDMGVSHSLSRCFFWSENVLWKHDIAARAVTVSLAERDLIVDTKAVRSYLMTETEDITAGRKGTASSNANENVRERVISRTGQKATTMPRGPDGQLKSEAPGQPGLMTVDSNSYDFPMWKDRKWAGTGLDLIWFQGLDHAQVFDKAQTRTPLIDAISYYSRRPH